MRGTLQLVRTLYNDTYSFTGSNEAIHTFVNLLKSYEILGLRVVFPHSNDESGETGEIELYIPNSVWRVLVSLCSVTAEGGGTCYWYSVKKITGKAEDDRR